jgi:GT2 family glycosyltransferase
MRLGAVVLSHEPGQVIVATVETLQQSSRAPAITLVVDNASTERSIAPLKSVQSSVEIVRLETNDGYGAAMNLGAERLIGAGCDRLLFLTQETMLTPGSLASLLDHLDRNPEVGLVGPTLGVSSAPSTVWSAGGLLTRIRHAPYHLEVGVDVQRVTALGNRTVTWLDGACLLVRSEAFTAIGGFRTDLFLYYEDIDLALKMRRQGWAVTCVRRALAYQESSTAPPYLDARNRAVVLGAWGTVGVVIDLFIRLVRDPMQGRGLRRVTLMLRGLADAARGRLDRRIALDCRS